MGTRGAYGFYKGGVTKATYNHFDSYPSGLGATMIDFVRENSDEVLNSIFDKLIMVNEGDKPTEEQIKQCEKWTNLAVSEQSKDNWYCLLRNAQGVPEEFNKGLEFMIDGQDFIQNSLFCEYAYIINLEARELEFYVGFQDKPNSNRYSLPEGKRDEGGYFACALAKTYSFEELRSTRSGELIEDMEKAEKDLENQNADHKQAIANIAPKEFNNNYVEVAVFVTNIGMYNEGKCILDCGKWVVLPIDEDEKEQMLEEIGIDGERYEEYVITDSKNEFDDIWKIGENDDLDTINEVVETLEYMNSDKIKTVRAVVQAGFENFEDAVDMVNRNKYSLYEGIKTAEDYAVELCNDCYEIPDWLQGYVDFEKLGEDWLQDNSDAELTDYGLVRRD